MIIFYVIILTENQLSRSMPFLTFHLMLVKCMVSLSVCSSQFPGQLFSNYLNEAGLLPIHMGDLSRSLYFVFQPKLGDPVDELTIWLNGGPGYSLLLLRNRFADHVQVAVLSKVSYKRMEDSFGAGDSIHQLSIHIPGSISPTCFGLSSLLGRASHRGKPRRGVSMTSHMICK
jgi:hypothetical protein